MTAFARRPESSVQIFCVAIAALGVAVATRPRLVPDDATMTFRYAERLAAGRGFTFNDHERVNGASGGLYTLVLGGLRRLGLPVAGSAAVIAILCFVAAVALAWWLARSLAGDLAGLLAAAFLVVATPFRGNALTGMELGLAAALGLGAIAAARAERDFVVGVLVGLSVWNRLDGAFVAVAVGVALWAVRRRPPWKVATIAAAVASPYLVFCWVYFGSPLPQSARSKLTGGADEILGSVLSRWWVLSSLLSIVPCLWAAALVAAAVIRRRREAPTGVGVALAAGGPPSDGHDAAVLAMAGWPLLHGLFFSLVPLGGQYPWYLTVLVPPAVVLGSVGAMRWWYVDRHHLISTTGAALVAFSFLFCAQAAVRGLQAPPTEHDRWQANLDTASQWLADDIVPGEVVDAGCWGRPAGAVPFNPVIDPCQLNGLVAAGPADWRVTAGRSDEPEAGFCERQRFGRDGDPAQVVVLERSSFGGDCG